MGVEHIENGAGQYRIQCRVEGIVFLIDRDSSPRPPVILERLSKGLLAHRSTWIDILVRHVLKSGTLSRIEDAGHDHSVVSVPPGDFVLSHDLENLPVIGNVVKRPLTILGVPLSHEFEYRPSPVVERYGPAVVVVANLNHSKFEVRLIDL